MSGQLLNRSCRRATHRQVRAERVTESMRSTRWNPRESSCLPYVLADDVLRER